ncbi:MAG: accessory factor UbiK family protein [Caulobacteraceae bacterium]
MQTQNPFLDEMAKLAQAAMGIAQAAGEEARSAVRAQTDRWAADLDLVRREEYDALKAEVAALRADVAALGAAGAAASAKP